MIVSELIAASYLKATGQVSVLTAVDDDWKSLLASADFYQKSWQNKDDWSSLYDPAVNIGTVTATDTFDLDASIRYISNQDGDSVRIMHTDGVHYTDYTLIKPKLLKRHMYGNYCSRVQGTLKFNKTFLSTDRQFGGTIYVPAYGYVDSLVGVDDVIEVDDPNWLVCMVSADYVHNDVTRAQNYPDFIAEAQSIMTTMQQQSDGQDDDVAREPAAVGQEW